MKRPKSLYSFVPFLRAFPLIWSFNTFAEFIMTSDEPQVIGLDNNNNPVYNQKSSDKEASREIKYRSIIQGVKAYASDFSNIYGENEEFSLSGFQTAKLMKCFCLTPSSEDIVNFSQVEEYYHNDGSDDSIIPIPLWKLFQKKFCKES